MKRVTIILLIALGILSTTVFGDDVADAGVAFDKKEYKKAFKLYNLACDDGNSFGCTMVGAFFEGGSGIQRNDQKALAYYSKACDMGHEYGCESHTKLQAKLPVCTENELSFANDKRYFDLGSSESLSSILADTKSITIDKKNKIIKFWRISLDTENGKQSTIKAMSSYYNYDNYGYTKSLDVINYGNMKSKGITSTHYNCDGSVIFTFPSDGKWADIIPGSVMESITESIMKKYNLK